MARPAAAEATRPDGASAHLTRAIARGDPDAFGAFYELWFDRAFAMARSISRRDEAFCLDVVQDAMLRVVRGMRPLATEQSVCAFMAKVLYTTALDRLRQERRRTAREQHAYQRMAGAEPADPAAELEQQERAAWLRLQLEALPEPDRQLILERFGRDQTLEAAGAAFGITGHAAHGRIRRILRRVRDAAKEIYG